jgi:hypothetical protein
MIQDLEKLRGFMKRLEDYKSYSHCMALFYAFCESITEALPQITSRRGTAFEADQKDT